MHLTDAIEQRRTIKRFTERPVTREQMESLLASATMPPNHRLTQPWRFHVLGPEARYAYGLALGNRKAKKLEDPAAAQTLREAVATEHRALPAMLVVAMTTSDNAEIREEDYAATMMGIANLGLVAVELGLGTAIRTGAVMDDPAARAAAGVPDGQRIIAIVNVGEPADVPPAKQREASSTFTTWLP